MDASAPDAPHAPDVDPRGRDGGVVVLERRPACASHGRAWAVATCRGCGLFLCADCAGPEAAQARCARCKGVGHPIPWEDPSLRPGVAYRRTLRALTGESFFATAPWTGGLLPPLRFAVLSAAIGALATFVLGLALSGVLGLAVRTLGPHVGRSLEPLFPVLHGLDWAGLPSRLAAVAFPLQVGLLVLAPLQTALELVVVAALSLPVARLLGGQGTFEATFRVLAYAAGAEVLHAIPLIGGTLALLAWLVLVVVGMRRAHGLSPGRAIVVALWWVPVAVVLVLVLGLLTMGSLLSGLH